MLGMFRTNLNHITSTGLFGGGGGGREVKANMEETD